MEPLKSFKLLLGAALLLLTGSAVTAEDGAPYRHIDFSKETPTATVEINAKSIRLLAGGSWGSGVLHFQDKSYPFKVKGLTAGGIGVSAVDAVGDVYFLKQLKDLNGNFAAGTIGATAVKGAGAGTFENGNGVILSLKAKTKGLALSLGTGGFSIQIEE